MHQYHDPAQTHPHHRSRVARPRYRWLGGIVASLLVLSLVACGGGASGDAKEGPATQSASMVMSFGFDELQVGLLAASEKGLYTRHHVDMKLINGTNANSAISLVASGKVPFGSIDSSLMLKALAQSPDSGLVMIATIVQSDPFGCAVIKGAGIDDVKDLAHATFGDSGGSAATTYPTFLKVALKGTGVPADKFKSISVSPSGFIPALLTRKVDVVSAALYKQPEQQRAAKVQGHQLSYFSFAEHGFNPYSYGIVTTRKYLSQHPDVAREVVAASLEGWSWVTGHTNEAAGMLRKHEASDTQEMIDAQIKLALNFVAPPETANTGLGSMSDQRWQETSKLATEGFAIANPVPVENAYTEDYLPSRPVKPAQTYDEPVS